MWTIVKVHTLHVVGLHVMIVVAKCQLSADSDTDYFSDSVCDSDLLLAPVLTLYVMSLVRVSTIDFEAVLCFG